MRFLWLGLALLLPGCSSGPPPAPASTITFTDAQARQTKGVLEDLAGETPRDPNFTLELLPPDGIRWDTLEDAVNFAVGIPELEMAVTQGRDRSQDVRVFHLVDAHDFPACITVRRTDSSPGFEVDVLVGPDPTESFSRRKAERIRKRVEQAIIRYGRIRRVPAFNASMASPMNEDSSTLVEAGFHDELTLLYPDTDATDAPREWTSDTARGWLAGVHLLVQPQDIPSTGVRVTDEQGRTVDGLAIYRIHDVPVEENTGLDSRTEQFKGSVNPHVVRRAPFQIYEAIEPLAMHDGEVIVSRTEGPIAYRLEVQSDEPGSRVLLVDVTPDVDDAPLEWTVRTHDWASPSRQSLGFGYTNWFSPSLIARYHDVELWSDAFWPVLVAYAELMARGGQDTFWMKWPDFFERDGDRWVLNEARLDRFIRIFLDAGLYRIEGAPIARRPGGDWSSSTLELSIPRVPANDPEGRLLLADMAGQLSAFMSSRGWTDQWVQHIADEPTDVNAEAYRLVAEQMHELLPGVPIMEATMTRSLSGAVDIWCPKVNKYQENRAFFDARRAEGDQVWTYTCLAPGGPWLNRLMDQERLRSVYFAWAAMTFDVDGYLHWGLNHYKADPFEQSVVDHPAMPGTTNKLPAGDTHVVFPGPDGPWSSTRFEAQRIGLEDLAALQALKRSDPQACQRIVDSIFRGYDDWEDDVETYRQQRRALLEAVASAASD